MEYKELLPNVLPNACNNPKIAPYNTVTEQFTGPGGFTAENQLKLWLYKINRSVNISS